MKLASRTAEIMASYPWPGNVRQLRNAVERMAVLARTDTLTPDLLRAVEIPRCTPTFLSSDPNLIFSDGFESGDVSSWSSVP